MPDILVVEDDAQIAKFMRISLTANGLDVREARRGTEALDDCARKVPDLVILDLGLPDVDGREVVKRLREWTSVPIIVLSVRSDDAGKVGVLDDGANDYVTKPFSISELMARVRVLLREPPAASRPEPPILSRADVVIDLARRRVFRGDEELRLSRKEYDLLKMLAMHDGRVITHQQILRAIWGPTHTEDVHYLRILVGHLRRKLGDDPACPRYVHTVQGVGYRFADS